jgi:hypothetical protein
MHRLHLTQYDERGWRATFYVTGIEYPLTSDTASKWEPTSGVIGPNDSADRVRPDPTQVLSVCGACLPGTENERGR